ncbi:MAG: hypothetical protein KJZ70_03410 [Bryobacterales bacterium]|nr:hypothetical protein [Bryobacterales bacterium]
MCHQSVGLIQSVIEAAGIPTVSISLLREVTENVKPPRVLFVDRPLGFPLGYPGRKQVQREILRQALALLRKHPLPVWRNAAFEQRAE